MDIEQFRNYCLHLKNVTEKTPFGKFSPRFDSILAFYVNGHMFCLVDINDFTYVELRVSPAELNQLIDSRQAVAKTINPVLKDWVHIDFGGELDDDDILALVAGSYYIIRSRHHNCTSTVAV